MAGQVERDDVMALGQDRLIQEEGVEVAGEAVEQDQRRPGSFAQAAIGELPAAADIEELYALFGRGERLAQGQVSLIFL